ncbi:MAG: hypothetical protein DWQ02_10225, partial [Bacteroidetes bacterium]
EGGKRNSKTALLAKIKSIPQNEYKNYQFSHYFHLGYFEKGINNLGIVNFKHRFIIDIDVLDLCVFNPDGYSQLNIQGSKCPEQLHQSWHERFELLHKSFDDLSKNIEEIADVIGEIEDDSKRKIIEKRLPPIPSFPKLPLKTPYFDDKGGFDFGIQRMLHLKEPKSNLLLRSFNRYVSRDAESHDFAKKIV